MKSKILLTKLLQSVDLTCLPKASLNQSNPTISKGVSQVEHSAREVSLPALLLQQALRAHRVFLTHHASSLTALFSRVPHDEFRGLLKRFWNNFLGDWDVLLHGSPAVDIYNGIKLSAGGELGIGVGEEDRGSGEREVLEGFIGRTEGLIDLLVSRFEQGPFQSSIRALSGTAATEDYGSGGQSAPSDGVIFSGIGALTRPSIRDISAWVESIAVQGANAYGIRDDPSVRPRGKRTKEENEVRAANPRRGRSLRPSQSTNDAALCMNKGDPPPGIPAPIVKAVVAPRRSESSPHKVAGLSDGPASKHGIPNNDDQAGSEFMKYLTLGVYGSSWGIPAGRPLVQQRLSSLQTNNGNASSQPTRATSRERSPSDGYFLVGLLGDLEEDGESDKEGSAQDRSPNPKGGLEIKDLDDRILVRHLHVERSENVPQEPASDVDGDSDDVCQVHYDRLRVVIYIQKPFIFTFLFDSQTDTLSVPSFYRSLHHQLGPLQRPLLKSTDPARASRRLWDAASTKSTAPTRNSQPILDLIYDPSKLTVHTSIPNIPEPGLGSTEPPAQWTRLEALSVHSQIINTYISTRRDNSELERTCKTSRSWWVVWMRLPHSPGPSAPQTSNFCEAILIRRASDYVAPRPKTSSLGFGRSSGGESGGGDVVAGWGAAKLAEGIGIDARQYIEGLLSLSR